ncbi:MAG: EutN/CcmL family microcompartment protein, partial [Thermoguttaceae bacterium]|nr:EutN/CcmL family microcompartment protein [Thermoguttaceae bacterium]
MFIAKVVGSVVATQKTKSMVGCKLLMIEPYVIDPKSGDRMITTSRSLVAVDTVGAG